MHVLISASSAWSYGGAILTFVFPELLFIFVAGALWVAFTAPHPVPGHRQHPVWPRMTARSATATPGVAIPGQGGDAAPEGAREQPAGGQDADGQAEQEGS